MISLGWYLGCSRGLLGVLVGSWLLLVPYQMVRKHGTTTVYQIPRAMFKHVQVFLFFERALGSAWLLQC